MQPAYSNERLTFAAAEYFKKPETTSRTLWIGTRATSETLLDSLMKLPYGLGKSPCPRGRNHYFFRNLAMENR
jgi:hypothetical protein